MSMFNKRPLRRLVLMASFFVPVWLQAAEVSDTRQTELKHLLIQDCGSCHGLRMKGGLGPALTPQDLAGKPKDSLVATVVYGRPGTAMPPWDALLTENEAEWLIDLLLQGVAP